MKQYKVGFFLLAGFLSFSIYSGNIYSVPLRDIDGNGIDLNSFRGKKMLIIVLPSSETDSSVSSSDLAAIETQYSDSLQVIGVPAEEFGYSASERSQVKSRYADQAGNFLLAEGMKVKKSSGAEQSALFQWLTDREKNRRVDREIAGTGHKFFIDESGLLYAVMGPGVSLSSPVITSILSRQIP